jgi:hypothetical protein
MRISYFVKLFGKLMDFESFWLLVVDMTYEARPIDLREQGCWPQV